MVSKDFNGGFGYNPDSPTADDSDSFDSWMDPPAPERPSGTADWNPDTPTYDSAGPAGPSDNWGMSAVSQQAFGAANYNPDSPTAEGSDRSDAWNESPAPASPSGTAGFNPDSPTMESAGRQDDWSSPPSGDPFGFSGYNPDEATADSSASRNSWDETPQSAPPDQPVNYSPDHPTGEDENPWAGNEGPSEETPPVYRPPVSAPEVPGESRKERTKKKRKKRETNRGNAASGYQTDLYQWRFWIIGVFLILLLALALLAGAFAGGIGVVFVILAAASLTAILAASGKLAWVRGSARTQNRAEHPEVNSGGLRLIPIGLPGQEEMIIRKEEQLLGSDQTLCLQPLPYKGISHRHCMIISRAAYGSTSYMIRDEGSKNGTRLNNRKLEAGVEYPLQDGDIITLAGRYRFRVAAGA